MSDEFVLRDERGNPLTSIFHEVPKKENNFLMVKLFDTFFPPIEDFHPDDYDEEVKEK